MKLYEALRQSPGGVVTPRSGFLGTAVGYDDLRERVASVVGTPPMLVDVSNVARWWFTVHEKESVDPVDFPNLAPPWPDAWFEYTLPRLDGIHPTYGGARVGVHMKTDEDTADGWVLSFMVFVRLPNAPDTRFQGGLLVDVERLGSTAGHWWELAPPCFFGSDGGADDYIGVTPAFVYPAMMALGFTHCKNVKMVEHATPPKVAAKRAKSGKPVGVTYKTLVIDGMKETLRTEGGIAQNGLKKALHICRGHFATYTADKPLFGKVVGTVWKPMHTRGSKERGEVKKDYKVVAGTT